MAKTDEGGKRPGAALMAVAVILSLCSGYIGGRGSAAHAVVERTDTLTVRDTVVYYRPVVTEVRTVRTDTVRLAVVQQPDTVFVHDTVEVEVPIMFSRYRGDNYDIGVSGFRTELEYVKVYPETKVITKSVTVRQKDGRRRWSAGAQAGYGLTIRDGRAALSPYVGVGVSYNIMEW